MTVGRPMHADGPIGKMLAAGGFLKNDLLRSVDIGADRVTELLSGATPTIEETAYLAVAFGVPARVIRPDLTDAEL